MDVATFLLANLLCRRTALREVNSSRRLPTLYQHCSIMHANNLTIITIITIITITIVIIIITITTITIIITWALKAEFSFSKSAARWQIWSSRT